MAPRRDLSRWLTTWARLWKVPTKLATGTTVRFNPRLQRAWGRVQIDRKAISLHPALQRTSAKRLQEVLCHEFAHIAAAALEGRGIRPHGPEWAALVEKAGFRPSRFKAPPKSALSKRPSTARFEHRCPVCQMTRVARRAVPGWRCAACVANGLEGLLLIRRLPQPGERE